MKLSGLCYLTYNLISIQVISWIKLWNGEYKGIWEETDATLQQHNLSHLDPLVPTGPASSGSTVHSLDSFHNQSPVSSSAPLAFAAALPGILLPLTSTQMVHLSLLSPPHGGLVQQRRLVTLHRIILKQCSADHYHSRIFSYLLS